MLGNFNADETPQFLCVSKRKILIHWDLKYIIFCNNKCHYRDRTISKDKAKHVAESNKMKYYEFSANKNRNIDNQKYHRKSSPAFIR